MTDKADGPTLAHFAVGHDMPELGPLTGRLLISDSSGNLGMDFLRLGSVKDGIMTLKVDGRFEDFARPETFRLNLHLKAGDAKPLSALLGWEWSGPGAVEMDAEIKQTDKGSRLRATAFAGKEKLDMLIHADFRTRPPQIKGRITASNFYLPDLAEMQSQRLARTRGTKQKSPFLGYDH